MLELWHIWIIAGLILWIIEIFTPGFVLGVFGTACLITAPFAWAGFSYVIQFLIFAVAAALLSLFIRPIVLRHIDRNKGQAKTNIEALIGQSGIVVETIDNIKDTGYIKIYGETWRAVNIDDTAINSGEKVRVKDIEGNKLIVEPIPKD